MDHRTAVAFEQWLTTDPDDRDYDCYDADNVGYGNHDFDGPECSRCGAESDEGEC